jgi:hypothetical protein
MPTTNPGNREAKLRAQMLCVWNVLLMGLHFENAGLLVALAGTHTVTNSSLNRQRASVTVGPRLF